MPSSPADDVFIGYNVPMTKDAVTDGAILSFQGEYRFLSNFWVHDPIVVFGHAVTTVEHIYQAMKASDSDAFINIVGASAPGEAKRRGRDVALRSDWESIKVAVMTTALQAKFELPELRRLLLATGELFLVEGNTWNDRYWGVCRGSGMNTLGHLLMQERALIRAGQR